MKKTILSLVMLTAICSLAGVAYVHASQTQTQTVNLWIWSFPDQVGVFNEIAAAFEKDNPDIKIEMVVPNVADYLEKLTVAIAAGAAPDVAYLSQGWMPPLAVAGSFADLTPYINRDGYDLNAYFPAVMDSFRYGDKVYGLPFDFIPHAIAYNIDLFDAAGLSRPPDQIDDMDRWKWADFRIAVQKIQERHPDGSIKTAGFRQQAHWREVWFLLWQNGAEFLNSTCTRAALNTSAGIEAYQFFVDLIHVYDASPKLSEISKVRFEQGNVGMQSTAQGYGTGLSFTWDYTFMPWQVNKATTMSLAGYAMMAQTKVPEAAWRVISYFAGEKANRIHVQTAWPRNVPAMRSAASSAEFLQKNPYYRVTLQSTAFARIPDANYTYRYNDIQSLATSELRKMLEQTNSVPVGMERIAMQVNAMLAEDAAKGLVWSCNNPK